MPAQSNASHRPQRPLCLLSVACSFNMTACHADFCSGTDRIMWSAFSIVRQLGSVSTVSHRTG